MRTHALAAATTDVEHSQALAYTGLTLTTACWAGAFVLGKVALGGLTPLTVGAARYAIAGTLLLPLAIRARPRAGVGPARASLAVMVAAGGVLYPCCFLGALARTSATNTSLLLTLNPALTLLLAPLVGEPIERRRFMGVALALAGAAAVISHGDPGRLTALSLDPGDLLALAAAAVWAVFNVASRHALGRLSPLYVNGVVYTAGGLALWGLGRAEQPWTQLATATPTVLGALVAMSLLSSVIGGSLFLAGVRAVGAGRAAVFVYLTPVLTALLAAALLGERMTAVQGGGGAVVLAGVWLATHARRA
jgi:drug/metabolite transporter (DMT)-like permease